MMSVSDLSSEQTGPNLHCLIYRLLICATLQIDVHETTRAGVHSLPEVLHRDTKWPCHLNTSGLTRTMAPTWLFPWWPQLPQGAAAEAKSSSCPLLPVSARRARLQIHLIYLLRSPGTTEPGASARGSASQTAACPCGTTASWQQLTRQRRPQNAAFNCSYSTKNRARVVPGRQTVSHVSVALIIL